MVVVVDTHITPELEIEGYARELIRSIQDSRKSNNFEVSDSITIEYHTDSEKLQQAFSNHKDYILKETLGVSLTESNSLSEEAIKVDGETITLSLKKA